MAAAVAVSGFVALTLTPMMCSKILKAHESHGGLYLAMERFFTGMTKGYRAAVGWTLRSQDLRRWLHSPSSSPARP